MEAVSLTVLYGKSQVHIEAPSTHATLGSIRIEVEKQLGLLENGVSLLFKGKRMSDTATLESAGIKEKSKLMAMRTMTQHKADKKRQNKLKLSLTTKSPTELEGTSLHPEKLSSLSSCPGIGDPEIPGEPFIIIQKGRDRIRVNISTTATVYAVKVRLASFEGLDVEACEVRLLSSGKFLRDEMSLADYNVKEGATIMALFSAGYHDKQEALSEIGKLFNEVERLEREISALNRRIEHRSISADETTVVRSELLRDVQRIRDGVHAVRGVEERVKRVNVLLKRLDALYSQHATLGKPSFEHLG